MAISALYRRKAPQLVGDFANYLGLADFQAAGLVGNLGHESGGFAKLQEIAPTVKGSRGGYGWAQWTGPRRRAYEAWCKEHALSPASDEANYRYVVEELTGPERAALAYLKRTKTLEAATETVMRRYERPGIEHLASRQAYAAVALDAYRAQPDPRAAPANSSAPARPAPALAPPVATPVARPSAIGGFFNRILGRADALAPAAAPLPAEITKGDPAVYRVQGALIARGYAEVGEQDGDIGGPGSKTRAAIRAAQEANGLPITGEMDPAFLAALPSMPARQPAAVREKTVKQLVEEGSTPAKAAVDMGFLGRMLGLGGVVTGVQQTGLLDILRRTADTANDTLGSVQGVVTSVIGVGQFVVSYWWIILVGLGLWGALAASERALRIRALYRQGTITRASA